MSFWITAGLCKVILPYSIKDRILMSQTFVYRIYSFDEANQLLRDYGFEYQPVKIRDNLFIEFNKL